MIEVQVAGAGAGKTYRLASSVQEELREDEGSHKKVFALTYTNSATNKIHNEIVRQNYAHLPRQVEVQTFHTFLLNEIIYPFSPFILSEIYTSASTINLNQKYKASEIRRLKNAGYIHVEDVYAAARRCIDKNMSMHNSKPKKEKVDKVLSILSSGIGKIFIDEVQDLDETALKVIEILGTSVSDVYLVGDPKQAIRYPYAFSTFLDGLSGDSVNQLPIINTTRRLTDEILKISNLFCPSGQTQNSISDKDGTLRLIESTHPEFEEFINKHLDSDSLVCIDKKQGSYSTSSQKNIGFYPEISELVLKGCLDRNPEIYLEAAQLKFHRNVSNAGSKKAVQIFLEDHVIQYDKTVYAQMMQTASAEDDGKYRVSSIDSVKGLEAETCVFILTPNTYKYLTKTDLSADQEHNKEWKKVYVALTRAKSELIVVLDHHLFEDSGIDIGDARDKLFGMGFLPY